jgi:glycosyltransferase involved in cell wall biosynthesis
MDLTPDAITIAVTVYSRREFVLDAIQSALDQTIPVKVIVVEDCGPDRGMKDFITGRFGDRITYLRNPKNRGLFDNWNACMEYCRTPWLSILHDDDVLRPGFVETMLALNREAPGCMIYFGCTGSIDEDGRILAAKPVNWGKSWRELDLVEFADGNAVFFPGQLFRPADARAVGNFHPNSFFTGDWDMWFKLGLRGGVAQAAAEVSLVRSHYGTDRGTTRVLRMGWKWLLDNVQRKRNLARLKQERGIDVPFDRTKLLKTSPLPTRYLLRFACGLSPRLLAYNTWLFLHSTPPHKRYWALQSLVRLTGPKGLRVLSILWNRWQRYGKAGSRTIGSGAPEA